MNGRLQGFLEFLDHLAEGQRRQAEVVTGPGSGPSRTSRRYRTAGNVARLDPKPASRYSTARNTSYAAILVGALAIVVSNSLALDQRVILERDVPQAAAVAVRPGALACVFSLSPDI